MTRKGLILHGVGGLYRVRLDDGTVIQCKARGAFRHEGTTPLVGDTVCVTQDGAEALGEDAGAWITEILPRRNILIRPAVANLDVMFVVCAAREPEPSLRFLDQMLCILESQNILPVLVVTKADLDMQRAAQLRVKYEKCGFTVFVTSQNTLTQDDAISTYIAERVRACTDFKAAFCGASGVGKSSLMNRLFPSLTLETGDLSEKIARGKHTTRAVSLFPIAEIQGPERERLHGAVGYIADTPGFSLLDFARFDFFSLAELAYTFREFRPYIGHCRYSGCTHTKEEGCAILAAVGEKRIPKSRHTSYLCLYDALKEKERNAYHIQKK